jgi:hypothetical protein
VSIVDSVLVIESGSTNKFTPAPITRALFASLTVIFMVVDFSFSQLFKVSKERATNAIADIDLIKFFILQII